MPVPNLALVGKHTLAAAGAAALAVLLATSPVSAAGFPIDEARGGIPTLAPLIEKVTPGVVNISVEGTVRQQQQNPLMQDPFFRRFFPDGAQGQPQTRQRPFQSAGSGVVVDARNGYLLTNAHVVADADRIGVTLTDGRQIDAKLVGTDPETDIAVLKVDANNLTAVPLGTSGSLKVGDFVIAVGNPFGLGQTVTSGIVSALGRGGLNIEGYEDFIQTDASINPGNSGGALLDLNGRLIGINTAILGTGGNIGIGFAVSIDMARAVMTQIIEFGEVQRGRLGVEVADVTAPVIRELSLDRPPGRGSVVMGVEPGSSAERAGLKRGDIITRLNGTDVRDTRDLRNRLALIRRGEQVEVTYARGDRSQTARLQLAAEPTPPRTTPAANGR